MSLIKNLVKDSVQNVKKNKKKNEKGENSDTDSDNTKNDDKKIVHTFVKTATDLQRMRLEKLMKNPEKPVLLPEQRKEKDYLSTVPTFVRNVMGSSAGAGSGEFHVYRHLRRKEYARQKGIQAKSLKEEADEAYHRKLEENRRSAEEKTAKKRAKRLKRKQRVKKSRNTKDVAKESNEQNESNSQSDTESDEKGEARHLESKSVSLKENFDETVHTEDSKDSNETTNAINEPAIDLKNSNEIEETTVK